MHMATERIPAFIYDWAIIEGENANALSLRTTPEDFYTFLTTDESVDLALFGRVKNDYRADETTGGFTDGHRIFTSPIFEADSTGICTKNTHYTLGEMSPKYAKWCKENGHDVYAALKEGRKYTPEPPKPPHEIAKDTVLHHICESCGKEELLTSEEGFNTGWDYPPRMGEFKIVSPRTCGSCAIDKTLWWEIVCKKTPHSNLSPKHLQTLARILSEPGSILPGQGGFKE